MYTFIKSGKTLFLTGIYASVFFVLFVKSSLPFLIQSKTQTIINNFEILLVIFGLFLYLTPALTEFMYKYESKTKKDRTLDNLFNFKISFDFLRKNKNKEEVFTKKAKDGSTMLDISKLTLSNPPSKKQLKETAKKLAEDNDYIGISVLNTYVDTLKELGIKIKD